LATAFQAVWAITTPGDAVAAILGPERALCLAGLSSRAESKPPSAAGGAAGRSGGHFLPGASLGRSSGDRPWRRSWARSGARLRRLSAKRTVVLSNFAPVSLALAGVMGRLDGNGAEFPCFGRPDRGVAQGCGISIGSYPHCRLDMAASPCGCRHPKTCLHAFAVASFAWRAGLRGSR
jgi:hypothetical protein